MQEPVPTKSLTLAELLRRPSLSLANLAVFWPELADLNDEVRAEAETIVKYAGYLARQQELVERAARLEDKPLPDDIDYTAVAGLTREVVEKLQRVRPVTLGQAARISGVTPAALTCVEIHLRKLGRF